MSLRATILCTCACSLLVLLTSGCGKPATVEDCELILTRITELELQEAKISDPKAVQAQIEETKSTFSETAKNECVGRRISAGALHCVENATSAKQIAEECFN